MRIRIPRRLALKARCYFWEAERSVHILLDPVSRWSEFSEYFGVQKKAEIADLLQELENHLPRSEVIRRISRADLAQQSKGTGFFRLVFGPWLAPWQSRFAFLPLDLHYLLQSLKDFLAFLGNPQKPDSDFLIQLRMRLCDCGYILEDRCLGWKEMKEATKIRCFGWKPWFPTVTIQEFLAKAA